VKALQLFLLVSFLRCSVATAQDTVADEEQKRLALYYEYSQWLGACVDSLPDIPLFEAIYGWLGVPYSHICSKEDGVDCSGFVSILFKKVYDIELPHSARDIYSEVKTINKKKLQTGDLVFFKIHKRKVSHVGVYLGYNKFAHASVQSGVTISDLNEPYYKKYFFKAGRVK